MASFLHLPPTRPRRRVFSRFVGGLAGGLLLWACLGGSAWGQSSESAPSLRIGYLAELPLSWRTGLPDPLKNIARSLGKAFARPVDPEFPLPSENVQGMESWEEVSRTIQLGGADLYPIQAYELLEHGRTLNLKPLLLATRNGRWQTRFLLLASSSSPVQSLHDLRDRTILIHRDDCGNLVDYWLDHAISRGTGVPRKSFARYQTVTQAREAVLPVFFGEADACVVSEAAYLAVCAQNPAQIPTKLNLTLATSEEFPSQVVVCRTGFRMDHQRHVLERAVKLNWESAKQAGGFSPAEETAFDHLRTLLRERANPGAAVAAPTPVPVRPPATAVARQQTSAPLPVKRP